MTVFALFASSSSSNNNMNSMNKVTVSDSINDSLHSVDHHDNDNDDGGVPSLTTLSPSDSLSDCSTSSLSPAWNRHSSQSSNSPSRSIFASYWSSPTAAKEQSDLLARLQSLEIVMPLDILNDQEQERIIHEEQEQEEKEDSSEPATTTTMTTTTTIPSSPQPHQRRQILPRPSLASTSSAASSSSPSISSSSSNISNTNSNYHPATNSRPWSSTSSLIKKPSQSCLKKSRYSSFSSVEESMETKRNRSRSDADVVIMKKTQQHHQQQQGGGERRLEFQKSVSFYSQVSVFEFTVVNHQEQVACAKDGWSKYFGL